MDFNEDIVSIKNINLAPKTEDLTEDVQVTSASQDIKPANKEDVLNG